MKKKSWSALFLLLLIALCVTFQGMNSLIYAEDTNVEQTETNRPDPVPEEQEEEIADDSVQNEEPAQETADEGAEPFVPAQNEGDNPIRGSPQAVQEEPAAGTPKQVDTQITDLAIHNLSGQTVDHMWYTDRFYLSMDWDASAHGASLQQGDYFDIGLPDQMVFPSGSAAADFNIYGSDGSTVIATAHVSPGPEDKGGLVRVTFTSWVEGKENVKGNIRLTARFDTSQVPVDKDSSFSVSVNGKVRSVPVNVHVVGPQALEEELLGKWGSSASSADAASWWVRINHKKAVLNNVVLSDHLSEGNGSETYIPDSFRLERAEMDSYGNVTTVYETVDLTDKLAVAPDGRSFTIRLGTVNADQYRLSYRTTYVPGTTLRNNVTLSSSEQGVSRSATHISSSSGGSGTGTQANRIKLIKVDANDHSITLPNAVFEVRGPDGSSFELTTGADGTVTSDALASGTYVVKEKTAPPQYELNTEEHTLQVNASGVVVQTIADQPLKRSVTVNKKWIGKEVDQVTVRLLADGADTDQNIVLNKDNGWTHTFDGLRQYALDGTEIDYTVVEDAAENYRSETAGDMASGYTITNTNTETISVPVTKQWVGDPAGPVKVSLLVDHVEIDSVILSEDGNWQHVFENLPKYDGSDGHEILYTVSEEKVEGYRGQITGSAETGFTITNTIDGRISVPVTKKWVGKEADHAVVDLYADGQKIDSRKLSRDNGWQYTFKDLDQYKDGKEIVYTIREEKVDGYSSTIVGSVRNGFVIINTYNKKENPDKKEGPRSKEQAPKKMKGTKTGADSRLALYTSLFAVSLGILAAWIRKNRKPR